MTMISREVFAVCYTGREPPEGILDEGAEIGITFHPLPESNERIRLQEIIERLTSIDANAYALNSPRYGPRVSEEIISSVPTLEIISHEGGTTDPSGFDQWVDNTAVTDSELIFTCAEGALTHSVAEGTITLIMALNLDLISWNERCKTTEEVSSGIRPGLSDQVLGIIGMGQIGQRVARIADFLGMDIIYNSTSPVSSIDNDIGAKWMSKEELLSTADIVSVHILDEEPDTLGEDMLAHARGIQLVNSAYPRAVEPAALIDAIEDGRITRAAIEGAYPHAYQARLREITNDRVILLPEYTSWYTEHSHRQIWSRFLESYREYLSDNPVPYRLL